MIVLWNTYSRALGMLKSEFWLAIFLVLANVGVAILQLAEPVLFGRVVDALARGSESFPLIGVWAFLGFLSVLVSVFLAVWADRLAHRQRLAAMSAAFDRAITLPISYHAERGSGRVVRTMLAGTDALFALWLTFLREHLAAIVSIALLIPTAIAIDIRLTVILVLLAVVYCVVNLAVIRRTESGQSTVERYHQDVFGRVGDVIGNVSVVQSYARLRDEQAALRELMQQLLGAISGAHLVGDADRLHPRGGDAQHGSRFAVGALLAKNGEISGSDRELRGLRQSADRQARPAFRLHRQSFPAVPTPNAFTKLLDATGNIVEVPERLPLTDVKGAVAYDNVTFRFGLSNVGGIRPHFPGPARRDPRTGRRHRLGQDDHACAHAAAARSRAGPHHHRRHGHPRLMLTSLRPQYIAVVFQEVGLFNRSIYDNIHIGRLDATGDGVEAAARMAEAHDLIMASRAVIIM